MSGIFIRDGIVSVDIKLEHSPIENMLAEPFTNTLQEYNYQELLEEIINTSHYIMEHDMDWD